jgi:hypothetical protein
MIEEKKYGMGVFRFHDVDLKDGTDPCTIEVTAGRYLGGDENTTLLYVAINGHEINGDNYQYGWWAPLPS